MGSQYPPLPTAPYPLNTLVDYINRFTLTDPIDCSTGPPSTSTTVDVSRVRTWRYKVIVFKLGLDMLNHLESRLSLLRLNAPSPISEIGQAPRDPRVVHSEADVRASLGNLVDKVNHVIKHYRHAPRSGMGSGLGNEKEPQPDPYPIWRETTDGPSGRPDWHLHTLLHQIYTKKHRLAEAKKGVHLRSILKLLARKAEVGFELRVRQDGMTDLDENFDEVGVSEDDRERIRKLLTQIVNEFITNDASRNLITDSTHYMLIQRVPDIPRAEVNVIAAHFHLSLPFGNRGLLNHHTPPEDLIPIHDPPRSLCHKPFGVWLALSFDDPTSTEDSPIKQNPLPPRSRSRASPRTRSQQGPPLPTSTIITRSSARDGNGGEHGAIASRRSGGGAGTNHVLGPTKQIPHISAIPDISFSDTDSSSDALGSPLHYSLGSSHLTLSFDLSRQNPNPNPYPRESGSPSPSHTLALRNGKVYGPFTPDRDGIGNGNGNGNGNKIGDKSDRCVPHLSQMSGGAWYYRPDTDSDAYTDESTEATGATHPFPSTTGTGTPAPTTSTTGTHVWTKTSGIEAPSPPFPHYEYECGRQVIRPTRPDTRVRLLSFLDRGRLWDTFRAELIYPGTSTGGCEGGNEVTVKSVIVKTTCPMLFPSEISYGVEKERYTQTEARSAIFREDKAYRLAAASGSGSGSRSGAASGSGVRGRDGVRARARGRNRGELALALAGRVMPRYLGLWGGVLQVEGRWKAEREIWVMILEDCGLGVVLEELTRDDKNEILSHYADLHAAGLVHNDPAPRHWLRHPDGGIRIIDFDIAVLLGHDASYRELVETEMKRVMDRLGLRLRVDTGQAQA